MARKKPAQRLPRHIRRLDPRLSTIGVMCLIGAVVAGGVEALGVQIPVVDSLARQALLGGLGLALVVASVFVTTRKVPVEEIAMSTDRVPLPSSTPRPKLSSRFTGRDELLTRARSSLVDQRRVALAGLGGVGKTQLALAYVERFRSEYEVVWWLRAEEAVALNEDYWGRAYADPHDEHGQLRLVFTCEDGSPLSPDGVGKEFTWLAKLAGLPHLKFHGLRHFAISLQLEAGVDMTIIAMRVGHTSPALIRRVYGHLIGTVGKRAAETSAALIPRKTHRARPTSRAGGRRPNRRTGAGGRRVPSGVDSRSGFNT